MSRIYMDYHATTPLDPRVLDRMTPFFRERFGNPASHTHAFGTEAREAVEVARAEVAALIGAGPEEIVFTSGATESNNLAIKGAVAGSPDRRDGIVTAAAEHNAVLDPCRALERDGRARVNILPVSAEGRGRPEAIEEALTEGTLLVSIMAANNEIGTIAPLAEIGRICKRHGVTFHTDAAQAAGKIPLDVRAMGIDLLSMSAHKMCGPKGVGALYVRRRNPRVRLRAILDGGGHEEGLRPGTLPVPLVVGFGEACRLARLEMAEEADRVGRLRDRLEAGIRSGLDDVRINGPPEGRLPGNLNVSFSGVEGESLLQALEGIAVSTGSACTSAHPSPSHVLRAIGLPEYLLPRSFRFGLGRFTTEAEVDETVKRVVRAVRSLREGSRI